MNSRHGGGQTSSRCRYSLPVDLPGVTDLSYTARQQKTAGDHARQKKTLSTSAQNPKSDLVSAGAANSASGHGSSLSPAQAQAGSDKGAAGQIPHTFSEASVLSAESDDEADAFTGQRLLLPQP